MLRKKDFSQTMRFVRMVAEKQGWKLNPDSDFFEQIVQGLNENVNRYGYYACPCRDVSGELEKDKDVCCPCEYNLADQKEYGHCFCALFLSKEFAESGADIRPIPERRPEELQSE